MIHETAIIDSSAEIASDVEIGPYTRIGPGVTIASGCIINAHATIHSNTSLDEGCILHSYACIGGDPQSIAHHIDDQTYLKVGKGVTFHEFATAHRGSLKDKGVTIIGDKCLLMSYSHVAHDCILDQSVRVTNCASLSGHVKVGEGAIIGAYCGIKQFATIGKYAMLLPYTGLARDVLPFVIVSGIQDCTIQGINIVGIKRAGFDSEQIKRIKKIYLKVFRRNLTVNEAIDALVENEDELAYAALMKASEKFVL